VPPSRVNFAFQGFARSKTGARFKTMVADESQATTLPVYRTRAESATEPELHSAEPGSEPTLIFRCNLILQTRDI
jgi:hypothetical protein